MRTYDPHHPLFFLHLPKSGGISVREVFAGWFGEGLLLHYLDEATGALPVKHDLAALHTPARPVALCGHFNKARGIGIPTYYPEAKQFITILRDPLERALSMYFFLRQHGPAWKDASRVPSDDLLTYLRSSPGRMVNHFPCDITLDNYREVIDTLFIEVGITEHLDASMARIARRLGRIYRPGSIRHLNATERDRYALPEAVRQEFIANNPLEYAIYHHVRAMYA